MYDSSRPVSEWLPPQEGSSTLTDLDHQESACLPLSAAAPSTSDVRKLEPLSDSEVTTTLTLRTPHNIHQTLFQDQHFPIRQNSLKIYC